MDYVRRRDRIIIKLPKVVDFYLATLIREEEGIFYVKLDRGDYFSFKDKSLIVERGIDRICPELITIDRIYDYIRGIGDAVTHKNKPETEALIPKVEEVITPEAEIRKEVVVDEKEEVEEEKSEDADSLEDDVTKDLETYDEEPEETPTEGKEPNSDDDMFDVPVEKLDESVTIDEKKPEESEDDEETEGVDESVEVDESEEPTEDNEEAPEESKEEIEKSIETEEPTEDNEEPADEVVDNSKEVDDSVEIEESEEPLDADQPEEVDDSVVIEDNDESPEEELSEEDDSVEEDMEEEEPSEEDEEESDEEVAVESNIEDTDIMVEDSANDDEGDVHEALFSNTPYYMRSLLLLEAARSFSKNDRLLIRVRAENKYYLATVTMNRKGMLHILFDHGEKHSLKPSSSLIMGIGQQNKYPYAITLNQLHRFLLVPFSTKVVKDRKTLTKSELHEKAKELIPKDAPVNIKRDNVGPYPVKPFKTSYKKKSIKVPKQDKHETGYLSKMSSKEIDEMLS